ncbi:hypothetical protein TRICI_006427 [Trichomonascus ciferrii]|uniref:Uncharacterized protein n=1 Tax=Trichomonascus ciferrii TaxID=44093 RepID=A0A642ULC7_9ASCO|nr:hypothetical protein TRICI_006427 [Trichomonascus ciferrii]
MRVQSPLEDKADLPRYIALGPRGVAINRKDKQVSIKGLASIQANTDVEYTEPEPPKPEKTEPEQQPQQSSSSKKKKNKKK